MSRIARFAASRCRYDLKSMTVVAQISRLVVLSRRLAAIFCALLVVRPACADVVITQGTNFGVDVYAGDGRVAMDLLGMIWILPARGGAARIMTDGLMPARQPRWSPDGSQILYQTNSPDGARLWLLDIDSTTAERIGDDRFFDQQASWHPDGERIVFSSARGNSGFDIWETDLPTGLSWRVSDHPGDETEPVWSRDGRHLAYIRKHDGEYSLVLRRHGEPEVVLLVSDQRLSSLAWRPDGTMLTILMRDGDEHSINMVILSEPPLVRTLITGEDFFASPVSWRDRHELVYTADGIIKKRNFEDRRSSTLPFRATISDPQVQPKTVIANRELELSAPPSGRLVIRGARLFDGIWEGYREHMDVLIDGGRIASVTASRDWDDATVLDLGEVTVLPGFIDVWSSMPTGPATQSGPRMLAYGVTTIVTDEPPPADAQWEGEQNPGPRVLLTTDIGVSPQDGIEHEYFFVRVPAGNPGDETTREAVSAWRKRGVPIVAESWSTGLGIGADLLVGLDSLPSSPIGSQYQDMRVVVRQDPVALISGLADSGTPGMSSLLRSRQAREFGQSDAPGRRFTAIPQLVTSRASIVLGSKPNGLPPGLALHAELRALASAGLNGSELLHAAGSDAARLLGLENQIGRITPGAIADLVLVSGDPLANPADALSIVAVVRSGRFFSLVGLLDKAKGNVELFDKPGEARRQTPTQGDSARKNPWTAWPFQQEK